MNLLNLLVVLLSIIQSGICFEKLESSDITRHISFLFFKGPSVADYYRIPFEDGLSVADYPEFKAERNTVFYFHGWTEQPSNNTESTNTIAEAFLESGKANLIIIDYAELVQEGEGFMANIQYLNAALNVTKIGSALGYFLKHYIPTVQPVERVHLVGHSMGAQVMSYTAKEYGQGQLKWLTGLDPARPLFNLPIFEHLSKEDAEFVDIIHTDAGEYGEDRTVGHADFFPNNGKRIQPYCKTVDPSYGESFCSHHMSWRYYAESVRNENAFPGQLCDRRSLWFCNLFPSVMEQCCNKDEYTHMGYGVDRTARGTYFLKTASSYPFDLGVKGYYV